MVLVRISEESTYTWFGYGFLQRVLTHGLGIGFCEEYLHMVLVRISEESTSHGLGMGF